jgi:prepilin peptidase CpaA
MMNGTVWAIPNLIASLILTVGVVDDMRSRKVHNWLFLACVGVALTAVLIVDGWHGLANGTLGFLAGAIVFLPFVLVKAVGAGDLKLLAAFGIVTGWQAVLHVAFFSIFWGALFGVVQVIFKGEGKVFFHNVLNILLRRKSEGLKLHSMPFTVALLFGWLTYLKIQGAL